VQKLIEIRKRMKTVRSIRSVARTMATVASAKLSRSKERAAGIREYTEMVRQVVQRQQAYAAAKGLDLTSISRFMIPRPVRSVLLLHVAGDRGMCGAYNMSVNRAAAGLISRLQALGTEVSAVVKGAKGERYISRKTSAKVVESATWPRAGVVDAEVDAIAARLQSAFLSGECDEVWCTYTRFYSPLRREPRAVRLLPFVLEEKASSGGGLTTETCGELWFYEPDMPAILDDLLGELLRLQVEDVLLESFASEQGARMITMEEATERADKMLRELSVTNNRLRREMITSDLIGVLFASRVREGEDEDGEAEVVDARETW
jgi:F-type H+-transporting ATPase subunit gamma